MFDSFVRFLSGYFKSKKYDLLVFSCYFPVKFIEYNKNVICFYKIKKKIKNQKRMVKRYLQECVKNAIKNLTVLLTSIIILKGRKNQTSIVAADKIK